jgi:hypothetical protein
VQEKRMIETKPKQTVYERKLDFYWRFLSIYTISLLVYSILKGSMENWTISIVLRDPLVILLIIFIIVTLGGLLFNFYKNANIIIGKDYIIFKTRFREKKYSFNEINKIIIGKDKAIRIKSSSPFIKFFVTGRRTSIRIRPSSYQNEKNLIHDIQVFKKSFNR